MHALTVTGAATAPYPLVAPTNEAAGTAGVAPGLSVAVDNTLGSFSPYEGRVYIAFTSSVGVAGSNTNVSLISSDDVTGLGAPSFSDKTSTGMINDDSVTDGFSEGDRPQFMATIAVDQTTGTLVASYYDGRYDPSESRAWRRALKVTSIDCGQCQTFSPVSYLNDLQTATDEITGDTVVLEPIPGNQGLAGALGFGDRQGLVVNGGHVIPIFSTNINAAGAIIFTDTVTIAAGPRIIAGDMGPITAAATFLGVGYNDTFAADGTQQFSGFEVIFDRPVLIDTFTPNQVTLMYHDTVTPAADPGVLIPNTDYTITGVDAGSAFGTLAADSIATDDLATTFLIKLITPLSAVGTYSYAIGPSITDGIRTLNTVVISSRSASPAGVARRRRPAWIVTDDTTTDSVAQLCRRGSRPAKVISSLTTSLQVANYPYTGDLKISLISPMGTSVLLFNQRPSVAGGIGFRPRTRADHVRRQRSPDAGERHLAFLRRRYASFPEQSAHRL